jgi:hypothetical protein
MKKAYFTASRADGCLSNVLAVTFGRTHHPWRGKDRVSERDKLGLSDSVSQMNGNSPTAFFAHDRITGVRPRPMNHLEGFLTLSTLVFQGALCRIVFTRGTYQALPLFAVFVYTVSATSVALGLSSLYFGFISPVYFYGFWAGLFLFVAARSLAIAELCRRGFHVYRGICALVWRVLCAVSVFLVAHAFIDAWGQPNGVAIYWVTFARDFALASVIVLAILSLFQKYYGLIPDSRIRLLAIGLSVTCTADAIIFTVLLSAFKGYLFPWFLESQKALWPALEPMVRRVDDIGSTVHLLCFMIAIGVWGFALRKPFSDTAERPDLLPVEVYRELSPAINLRLITFNERLLELLKP